jgi:acyl-CoA synthetase (AMP-forming)/AMP-acid ligase II
VPLEGVGVEIRGPDGARVGEACLGEIVVDSAYTMAGYVGAAEATLGDGRLATGDAGFMLGGELYVLGRAGDAVSVRGRTVYAEDLELALQGLPSVPRARVAVVAGAGVAGEGVTAVLEAAPDDALPAVRTLLRSRLGSDVPIRVLAVARGGIPRTSSGKVRRRALWQQLVGAEQ